MSRDVGVASRRSAACVRRVELYTIESRFPPRSGCRIQGYTTFYGKTLVKFGAKGGWHNIQLTSLYSSWSMRSWAWLSAESPRVRAGTFQYSAHQAENLPFSPSGLS